MTHAIPIVALRRKHLKVLTKEQAKERMRRAALCCALEKAWCEMFPEQVLRARKK